MDRDTADRAAVENACRDIDRYIAEASQAREATLSLSERLQVLGQRHVGTFAPQEMDDPLLPNEF